MNLTTEQEHGVSIVRVNEPRLLYPLLAQFTESITSLIESGKRRVLLDMTAVATIDSAAVGCLLDLTRRAGVAGGRLRVAGLQRRVEAMLAMTGADKALEICADAAQGVRSFD